MRQAGRYLPEYRKVRESAGSFLDLCYSPDLAAEVTLQPLRRYDLDAAIIFSDILVIPHAMGNGVSFVEGEGPVLETVRSQSDVKRLVSGRGSKPFGAVADSVGQVRNRLESGVSLIGFCGAPWTVASYMIEGRSSDRKRALACAAENETWFQDLIQRLVDESIEYLCVQVEAGADVLQIFDSWAGELHGDLFGRLSVKPIAEIVAGVRLRHPLVPIIVFAKGAGLRHGLIWTQTDCNAVGLEQEFSLSEALKILPEEAVLQGNLDPDVLLGDAGEVERAVLQVLRSVPRHRHVFNLGHGIRQTTDPERLSLVVETVRNFDRHHLDV